MTALPFKQLNILISQKGLLSSADSWVSTRRRADTRAMGGGDSIEFGAKSDLVIKPKGLGGKSCIRRGRGRERLTLCVCVCVESQT